MTQTPIDISGRIPVDKEESEESESSDEEPLAAEPQQNPKLPQRRRYVSISFVCLDNGLNDFISGWLGWRWKLLFFLQQMSPLSAQKQPEPEEEADPEPQTEKKRKKAGAAFFDRMAEGAAKKGAKK